MIKRKNVEGGWGALRGGRAGEGAGARSGRGGAVLGGAGGEDGRAAGESGARAYGVLAVVVSAALRRLSTLPSAPCTRCCLLTFFFFQAEDGIRDGRVTGVQTCALPICRTAATCCRSSRGRGGWRR